jgi:ABC-type multidrug transport system ATPase subunit
MPPAIDVHALTRTFDGFTAVDRIDLAVEPGQFFGFLGSNGAGKYRRQRILMSMFSPLGQLAVNALP